MTYRTTRRPGYTDDFRKQWEADQEAARKEQEERVKANERARADYLKGLADEKAAKQREADAKRDAALEPAKASAQRQWLYDHPEMTPTDFEKQAWPLLREQLIEDEQVEQAAVYFRQAGWPEARALAKAREIVNQRQAKAGA